MARRFPLIAVMTLALACLRDNDWYIDGTPAGPLKPSATDRSIFLVVNASHAPSISYGEARGGGNYSDCTMRWKEKEPLTCLLPPGASLIGVGMTSRCMQNCYKCDPPKSAHCDVAAEDVPIWTRVAVVDPSIAIPSPTVDKIPTLELLVDATSTNLHVRAEATLEGQRYGLGEPWCDRHRAGIPKGLTSCWFTLNHMAPGAPAFSLAVHAEATVYDRCATAPCSPPATPDSALRIVSMALREP